VQLSSIKAENGRDVHALDDHALHETLLANRRQIEILNAREAQLLEAWNTRKVWSDDGSKSCASRYARETGLSNKDAKHLVHRARKLSTMPLTLEAFTSGELSSSRVNLLVNTNQPRVSEAFARDEEVLLDIVKTTRFADACSAMKYWQLRADPDGSEDEAKRKFEARSAHISKTFDDVIKLDALFDPVNGEIFLNELQRLEDELFQHDWAQAKATHGDSTTSTNWHEPQHNVAVTLLSKWQNDQQHRSVDQTNR
jgi:hypothetical protein